MIITTNGKTVPLKQVSKWDFTDNSLGDECWPMIVEIVKKSPRLKDIILNSNDFTFIPCDMLEALKKVIYSYYQKAKIWLKNRGNYFNTKFFSTFFAFLTRKF